MVIQLPKDIEERLNELADREGRQPEQVIRELIEERLARGPHLRPGSASATADVAHESRVDPSDDGDVWGDEDPPWAGLIGLFPGGGVNVEEFDEWLAAARASDERLARKSSLKQ